MSPCRGAGGGWHRLKFIANAADFVRLGTAGPSTPAEAVGRDDTSRESAGCAQEDEAKGSSGQALKASSSTATASAASEQQVPPLRLKPSVGMTLQERVAGCAQEDSDRGDVTARLTPRPFEQQIPRGLKPARDDK